MARNEFSSQHFAVSCYTYANDPYLCTEMHYKCFEPTVMVFIFPAVMVFLKLNLGSEMVLSAGVIMYTTRNLTISHGCTQ